MEAIKDAAEQAHIAEFIAHLPEQYDTLVGERGLNYRVASVNVSQSLGQYWLSALFLFWMKQPAHWIQLVNARSKMLCIH